MFLLNQFIKEALTPPEIIPPNIIITEPQVELGFPTPYPAIPSGLSSYQVLGMEPRLDEVAEMAEKNIMHIGAVMIAVKPWKYVAALTAMVMLVTKSVPLSFSCSKHSSTQCNYFIIQGSFPSCTSIALYQFKFGTVPHTNHFFCPQSNSER
jgi:hypothetical protein